MRRILDVAKYLLTNMRFNTSMTTRFSPSLMVLALAVVGCGQAEKKELPKITPAQQADLDKGHAEAKAKMEGGSKPADAPK